MAKSNSANDGGRKPARKKTTKAVRKKKKSPQKPAREKATRSPSTRKKAPARRRAATRPIVRDEATTLLQLEDLLKQRIVGKDEAIERVANTIRIRRTSLDFGSLGRR